MGAMGTVVPWCRIERHCHPSMSQWTLQLRCTDYRTVYTAFSPELVHATVPCVRRLL